MEEPISNEESKLVVKAEAIINNRVNAKVDEIRGVDSLIASVVLALILAIFAYSAHIDILGKYTTLWAGIIGLVLGAYLGQKIVFTILGGVLGSIATYLFMQGH